MIQEHEFVGSSNILKATYRPEGKTLDVKFAKGHPYRYFNFPEEKFKAWLAADSAGSFHGLEIARKFQCVKLECVKCHEGIDPAAGEFDVFALGVGRLVAYHRRCSGDVNAALVKL